MRNEELVQKIQIVRATMLTEQDYSALESMVLLFQFLVDMKNSPLHSLYLKQKDLFQEHFRLCNEIEKRAGELKQSGDLEKYKEYILFAYERADDVHEKLSAYVGNQGRIGRRRPSEMRV